MSSPFADDRPPGIDVPSLCMAVTSVGLEPTEVTAVVGRATARVPPALLRRGRVLRPADAEGVYSNPRSEFARLERSGALHRLAPGHFAAVPDDVVGRAWLPPLEAVGLAIAGTGGHAGRAALMGVSAARVHAADPPRSVSPSWPSNTTDAHCSWSTGMPRSTSSDESCQTSTSRHQTELGQGWVTTVEQTLLDLIARPQLGGVPDAAAEAVGVLIPRPTSTCCAGSR